MQVSLLITCLTDTFYPRTGIAAVKVLEHLGCHVDFPETQTCCGQPLFNNGFHDEARDVARQMIHCFEQAEHVVTPSGSCAAMLREHFPELFEHEPDWRQRADALAEKTYEFIEFLVKVLAVDLRDLGVRWQGRATYHYSCHLRSLGMTDEATRLMKQIEALQFQPLEKVDQCCGFGGMFASKMPRISGSLVRDKVQCIQRTGADTVVSNDAGCTMNIAGACHREGVDVRFKSLAEMIAEGLGLIPTDDAPES